MKKAVIYAQYSSDRQNEQSIAGQINVCTDWAQNNDIDIVQIYHDEALSGKTDKRPGFQKMINDSKSGKFDYILVYKLDRFARNRYDSAIYKAQLKKYNVRIISAMENIADGPEGIILESVLEGMAEYYSANLAQNVTRGMAQKAEQGKYLGGTVPLGYKIDADKNYIIDSNTAPIVKQIYSMYAEGNTIREICAQLNSSGYTTAGGRAFNYHSMQRILTNPKYIGTYECMDVTLKNVLPKIVDDTLFEKVQERITKNKKAPGSAKSTVDFYLTGKLFCGKCGHNMVGDSGRSGTGATHFYYTCVERKRKHGCTKKSVKKDWIEDLITDITVNRVLTDEYIDYISTKAYEIYEKERNDQTELTALKNSLRETQKIIDNIMNAIEQGIITETTKERLMDAEERKKSLLVAIAKEEIKKPVLTKDKIKFFLDEMRDRIYSSSERIAVILQTFVNAVYLYDDKIVITYNFRDGEGLKKFELTELEKFGCGDKWPTKKREYTNSVLSFFGGVIN